MWRDLAAGWIQYCPTRSHELLYLRSCFHLLNILLTSKLNYTNYFPQKNPFCPGDSIRGLVQLGLSAPAWPPRRLHLLLHSQELWGGAVGLLAVEYQHFSRTSLARNLSWTKRFVSLVNWLSGGGSRWPRNHYHPLSPHWPSRSASSLSRPPFSWEASGGHSSSPR